MASCLDGGRKWRLVVCLYLQSVPISTVFSSSTGTAIDGLLTGFITFFGESQSIDNKDFLLLSGRGGGNPGLTKLLLCWKILFQQQHVSSISRQRGKNSKRSPYSRHQTYTHLRLYVLPCLGSSRGGDSSARWWESDRRRWLCFPINTTSECVHCACDCKSADNWFKKIFFLLCLQSLEYDAICHLFSSTSPVTFKRITHFFLRI